MNKIENNVVSDSLKNDQSKQSQVLSTFPVAFYTISTRQASKKIELTYLSESVKLLTGFDASAFDKENLFWENRIHPDDKGKVVNTIVKAVDIPIYELEYRWKCSDDEYKWFYDQGHITYDYHGKPKEVAGVWIDITDRKITEQSINLLIKKTSTVTGRDFFRTLVKEISEILRVNYVFISKCINTERTKVRTVAFWEKNKYHEDVEYDLKGTPCEKVISGEFCIYDDNVLDLYPNDEGLRSYNPRGFLGVPIYNSKNMVIGHLAVFHNEAFNDVSKYFSILKIFALRAGSELERIKSEESLRRSHDQLEIAYEQIKDLKSKLEEENYYLKEEIKTDRNFDEIIGAARSLKDVLNKVNVVADTDATVLIRGETGTGKELIARSIHNASKRRESSLIKVNCPAIPSGLIESELFGHEKGSFTGALARKIGKFELADGGTIFLDELGDLPLDAQAKLLRVLQEREFERVGGNQTFKINVRVIAATNRNLEEAVQEGKFREDLYYRLNVFPIELPSLRERIEDIPALSNYFMNKYSQKLGKRFKGISQETLNNLMEYQWPGNIRELESIIERSVILNKGEELNISDNLISSITNASNIDKGSVRMEDMEREHIVKILNQTGWQIHGKKGAARILDINPSTLRTRMAKLGIKKKTVSLKL